MVLNLFGNFVFFLVEIDKYCDKYANYEAGQRGFHSGNNTNADACCVQQSEALEYHCDNWADCKCTLNHNTTRPNCSLDKRTMLCLYVPGFQRQVFANVKNLSEMEVQRERPCYGIHIQFTKCTVWPRNDCRQVDFRKVGLPEYQNIGPTSSNILDGLRGFLRQLC